MLWQPSVTALLGAHTTSNRTGNGLLGVFRGLFPLQGEVRPGELSIQQLEDKIHPKHPRSTVCVN